MTPFAVPIETTTTLSSDRSFSYLTIIKYALAHIMSHI